MVMTKSSVPPSRLVGVFETDQLRQIHAIRKSLTAETSELLVHAFINRRPDYCNSILYGV